MDPLALLDSDFPEETIELLVGGAFLKHGQIDRRSGGMCGSVYFFDQGEHVYPRWIVVKIPRAPTGDRAERNRRFIRELEIQHRTYSHEFVCYPFDYDIVHDTPAALYRCSDGDLAGWIEQEGYSDVARLSTLAYLTAGLSHCRSRGVICHQDLKPQNVLMRNYWPDFVGLPDEDVFTVPLLADFGLANMWFDHQRPEGARPYMAPEQWLLKTVHGASDVFSLGVIIFEVMSRGMHPLGERTKDWWPTPAAGNSRKWLRDDVWKSWAKNGCPISHDATLSTEVLDIARDCMDPDPDARPSLGDVEGRLLEAIRLLDENAYLQARFRIDHANNQAGTIENWPYRNQRFDRLRAAMREEGAPAAG